MKITTRFVTPIGVPYDEEPFVSELRQSNGCCQKMITQPSNRLLSIIRVLRAAGPKGVTNVELYSLGYNDAAAIIAEIRQRWGYGVKSSPVSRKRGECWVWRFFLTLDKGHS
jgi:hypothetical protein